MLFRSAYGRDWLGMVCEAGPIMLASTLIACAILGGAVVWGGR